METIRRRLLPVLLGPAAGLLLAFPGEAQFVPLSRCRTALPCAIPFQVEYRPDPLIAAQYGYIPASSLSFHLALARDARFQFDRREPIDREAVEAAVRSYFRRHPARSQRGVTPLAPGAPRR